MPRYAIYGGCLASDIPFPQLRLCACPTADWTLRVAPRRPELADAEFVGEHEVDSTVWLRVSRSRDGFRLHYSDTGTFDVHAAGREIVWSPEPGARLDDVRDCVIGRVFATALHAAGLLCLHGSAVALHGAAVAFLAPPFHGKSTLALALTRGGAKLVTDDTVVVDPGSLPAIWPGVHSIRLFSDSAGQWQRGERPSEQGTASFATKHHITDLLEDQLEQRHVPLEALYLLSPQSRLPGSAAVQRSSLGALPAALTVLAHLKLGTVLGASEAPALMRGAISVARAVPVYRLEIVRDLERVDEAAAQLASWHKRPASPETASPVTM